MINWKKKTKTNYEKELKFLKPADMKKVIGYWLGFHSLKSGTVGLIAEADEEGKVKPVNYILALNLPKKLEMLFVDRLMDGLKHYLLLLIQLVIITSFGWILLIVKVLNLRC